ncbi:hypothetical protein FIBSPDRAFT_927058 [Athelia psychrophila]|uniref:Geranylgeranyl pyrophosphate synthetase n=1 Tax=Athelia psychrophila TaxID=1759441 RepID=A0A166SC90_9AGAM|nr:hypothetical protein FIBSPDRAFT_927058 [Fibularhizoctonia sp. CBS 109695]
MIVPGSPPQWLDRTLPFQVREDSGLFVDPCEGLLPLIRAVELMSNSGPIPALLAEHGPERVEWGTVDFVTDRSNLRKLLRWIDGSTSGDPIRMDAQLAGNGTVLLNRWESRTSGWRSGGYGYNLEKEVTKPAVGCEDATAHARIVKYNLGGLSMVVRFELDAFQPPAQSPDDDEDLLKALSALTVPQELQQPVKSEGFNIRRGGSVVPQSSLIELKSGKIKWPEVYPQLYVSQTPRLYKAAHENGLFHTITKMGLASPEMAEVAERSKVRFGRLRDALQAIKDMVVAAGPNGRLSFVVENKELKVFDRDSQSSFLKADVMALFS